MKKRFKNIFDNKKKRVGILSLTFILALVLCGSSLVACQSSPKASSVEEIAKGFLKGYYQVDNILLLQDLQALFDEEIAKGIPSKGGEGIVAMPEDGAKRYSDAVLKNVKAYIDDTFGESLIANRAITKNIQLASEYSYTLQVTNVELTQLKDIKSEPNLSYDYTLSVKLTYQQDGTSETQTIDGNISLIKADDKWLVAGLTEKTRIIPNKQYYKAPEVLVPPDPDASSSFYIETFSTSKDLCDAYIEAMLNSFYPFIANHTANLITTTPLAEGQKTWDTIKIDSIEIITSEERVNTKFPNMSKAYYQLEINVADPGVSAFEKGKNIRWLYLASSTKGDTTTWYVENLNNGGEPDDLWWDSVNGG